MPKVSVIIPVYNTEKYLEKCLDSVCNQTLSDIEIICINDCSPDNSINILNKYAIQDKRIKIVNRKENGGLSAARNSGIDAATGDYIYFIDSDDWINENYIEQMFSKAVANCMDIVVNTNILLDYGDSKKPKKLIFGNLNVEQPGVKIDSDIAINNVIWSACVHLYKRSFINENNLRFPEGYTYEDMYFTPCAYSCIDKIYVFSGPEYHYFMRNNSICRKDYDEYMQKIKFLSIFNMLFDYLQRKKYMDSHSCLLYPADSIIPSAKCVKTDIYEQIHKYFIKIEKYVQRDKGFYDKVEFEFFKDIMTDIEKAKTIDYIRKAVSEKLRVAIKKDSKSRKL